MQVQDKSAEKRAEIDEEIQRLRQRIQELSGTRNTLAPIASLPAEILGNIFALSQSYKHEDGEQVNGKTLVRVTSVCRYWRSTALDHPMLWAEINHTNRKWAVECLERSRGANLKVDASTHDWSGSFYDALLPHLARLQWLAISGYLEAHSESWSWSKPMSILHTLKLVGYSVSAELCSLELPALRVLELQSCKFSDVFPSIPSLKSLAIKEPRNLRMRTFLEGLSSALNLVSLELLGLNPADNHDRNTSALPHIPLLELSTFTVMKSTLLSASILIRQLAIPPRAQIVFDYLAVKDVEMFANHLFQNGFPLLDSHSLKIVSIDAEGYSGEVRIGRTNAE